MRVESVEGGEGGFLTLRRSVRMEIVMSLYLGTSLISLSCVAWSMSTWFCTLSLDLPLDHFCGFPGKGQPRRGGRGRRSNEATWSSRSGSSRWGRRGSCRWEGGRVMRKDEGEGLSHLLLALGAVGSSQRLGLLTLLHLGRLSCKSTKKQTFASGNLPGTHGSTCCAGTSLQVVPSGAHLGVKVDALGDEGNEGTKASTEMSTPTLLLPSQQIICVAVIAAPPEDQANTQQRV